MTKKLILLTTLTFLTLVKTIAQNNNKTANLYTLKVRPVKTVSFESTCEKASPTKDGVILEFDVLNSNDQLKFGKKLYVATICDYFPGEGTFKDKTREWDLVIHEGKYWQWEIKILNPEELDKNINKKEFWLIDLTTKGKAPCYPSKK